ncbi:MAG TPA: c-type cytochrome [Pyrinomonadaceae bacterium]|nr:c-type cytochrome [Pyrinomonadaceae bacterium]
MKARWFTLPITTLVIISTAFALSANPRASSWTTTDQTAEALATKSGCLECHSVDKKVTGPAFHDVAARYKDDPQARSKLIEKVKKGGKGNWIEVTRGVPMPPHDKIVSDTDIARLVDWVLTR